MKRTVIQLLHEAASLHSEKTYLSEKIGSQWVATTFKQADDNSLYLATALNEIGFAKGQKISLLSEGRTNWVVGEFGILKNNCISVPLSIKLLPEEILFRLNHSESEAIIISKNNVEKLYPIWSRLENKSFKLIFLDNDEKSILEISEKLGVKKDQNLFIIDELIEKGKKLLEKDESKMRRIEEEISENDVVTISYTSGTTGNPKGIMLTHLNYWANSKGAFESFKNYFFYKTLIILPLDHSFAHTVGIYIALLIYMPLYFVDAQGGNINIVKNIPSNLKEVKPQILLTVPALTGNFMKKIIDGVAQKGGFANWLFTKGINAGIKRNGNNFEKVSPITKAINYLPHKLADMIVFKKVRETFGGNLEFCIGGGALLDIKQQNFFLSLGTPVYQGYGLTEATPIISSNTPINSKLGTSGKVISGVTCKIIKSDNTEAKTGEKGEIVIKGLNVMKGYLKNESATNEVIKGEWLHTGDMGYYDKDNFLMVVGREKALLISQDGEKYSPEEIEEAITNSAELISQSMLYNDHSKNTTAIITLDNTKIKSFIKKHLIKDENELLNAIKESFYQFEEEKDYAGSFPKKWIPVNFRIVEEQFSEKNKMINSTMKMVRYKITETYKDLIKSMYEPKSKIICEENKKVLKNFFNN